MIKPTNLARLDGHQPAVKLLVCRDRTLASETILYARLFGREFYAWLDGSPAVGYRLHVSRSLFSDWWQLDRRGSYSRLTYRRLPSETWISRDPDQEQSDSDG